MNSREPVLERNLQRLFTRSYQPVRVRDEFRAELLLTVAAALAERGKVPRRRWERSSAAAAAAIFLIALGGLTAWLAWPRERRVLTHEEQLSRVTALVRESPAAPWRDPDAGGGIEITTPWLEIRTSSWGRPVLESDAGSFRLAPDSQVVFDRVEAPDLPDPVPRATLTAGAIESAGALRARDFHLRAAACEVRMRGGSFALAWLGPEERRAQAERVAGVDPAEPLAHLRVEGGELAWSAGPLEPIDEREVLLQAGRLVETSASPTAVEHGAREQVDEAVPPPAEVAADRWTVRGRLRTPDGAPLAGGARVWLRAVVELPKVAQPELHRIEDAAQGFVLTGTASGEHLVHVEAAGFAAWRSEPLALGPGTEVELDVALARGAALEGFVVDAASGVPVPGALVVAERDVPQQVLALDGSLDESFGDPLPVACTRSDAVGAFVLPHLAPGEHVLRASAATHAASWVRATAVEGASTRTPDLALRSGASLRGTVWHADGRPWSGAEIIAARIDLLGTTQCISYGFGVADDYGEYSMQHLSPGLYVVMNESEQPNTDPDWQRLEQVVLREGEAKVLDFRAGPSGRVVRGRLTDAQGAVLPNATLHLLADPFSDGWQGWSSTKSAEAGLFEFQDVPPGLYGLYLSPGLAESLQLLTLVEAMGSGEIALDVSAHATDIAGNLRAASDGSALVNTLIVLLRLDPEREQWYFAGKTEGDDAGRFALGGVPEGRYMLIAFDTDERRAQQVAGPFSLHVGEPASFDLDLEDGGAVVAHVVDSSGIPVSDARVWAQRDGVQAADFDPDGTTDEAGTIRLGALAPRRWVIHAQHEAHAPSSVEVQVRAGERHEVTLQLEAR